MTERTMTDQKMNVYEGLFLFPQAASGNLQAALDHLTDLLARANADVISLGKWDERRLAYEIKGNKRGVYFLAYFRAAGSSLAGLERDCNLSEQILRAMVTRAEHLPQEVIDAAEGRAKLADEIKLRAEQEATAATRTTATVTTGSATETEGQAETAGAAPSQGSSS